MKTFKKFIQSLIVVIFTTSFLSMNAQEIPINVAFSSDTTFNPFNGEHDVYSFKMTGGITFLSDSSLVRVVLTDHAGNHWLVYEAYPLIDTLNSFSVQDVCDETCFLDKITPDSIRVDIINAIVSIEKFTYNLNEIQNVHDLQVQQKWINDSVKINVINQNIIADTLYWRAGRTNLVCLSFQEKEQYFGEKFNGQGYEYYKGGVFQYNWDRNIQPIVNSGVVKNFDWRSRHGSDNINSPYYNSNGVGWLTIAKDQDPLIPNTNPPKHFITNLCYVFSPVGAVEARINLFYNIHWPSYPNIDLSEMGVWKCPTGSSYWVTGYQQDCFDRMKNYYIVSEACFPYTYQNVFTNASCNPPNLCSPPINVCKIDDYTGFPSNLSWDPDGLKRFLITSGPLSCILFPYPAGTSNGHYMDLVGFSSIQNGSLVYKGTGINDPDIIIDEHCPLIGSFYWWFKDSYDSRIGENGFVKNLATSSFWTVFQQNDLYVPTGSVNWTGHTSNDIQCTDEDGDGFYWWGIGSKPSGCQSWIPNEEDCDDSDKGVGPYNTDNYSYPLYQCMDNCPDSYFDPTPNSIPGNMTISTPCHVNYPVVIGSGKTLTINSTVWFHPNASITVHLNGKLIINPDAILTSECNKLWQGITIMGSSDLQTNAAVQGRIEDHGTIKSAVCAIKTSSSSSESGAIIIATGATFQGNATSIQLMPYSKIISVSKVQGCQFKANDTLCDWSNPAQFIKLDGLTYPSGIKFEGCTFTGTGAGRDITGVRSNNSYFYCQPYTISGNSVKTEFHHNLYGIYSTATSTNERPVINDCIFEDNFSSIYISGVKNAKILSNSISVPLITNPLPYLPGSVPVNNFSSYGIYLDQSTGFHVEKNTITSDAANHWTWGFTCGIYVNNSKPPLANRIYNNSLGQLHHGIELYGYNRNGNQEGLEIKCSNFSENGTDIGVSTWGCAVTENLGIKYDQGLYNVTGNAQCDTAEAGNTFTSDTYGSHEWDIFNDNAKPIRYNHHNHFVPPSTKIVPTKESSNVTNSEHIQCSYLTSSCPEHLNPFLLADAQNLKNQLTLIKTKIDSITTLLGDLVDGGNTEGLNQEIDLSMPEDAYNTYTDLINKSPFLSDTVMKSAILKELVLNNLMVRNILVANPQSAKSDSVLFTLDERIIPMPDSMMSEILEGRDTVGAKEVMESDRAYFYQLYGLIFNDLMDFYLSDTTHSAMNDSILSLYSFDFRLPSKYSLVFSLLESGQAQAADEIMNGIPTNYALDSYGQTEYNKYLVYYYCRKRAIESDSSITFDSVQVNSLDSLVDTDTSFIYTPTVYARNALLNTGLITYYEPLIYDVPEKSVEISKTKTGKSKSERSFMILYPNPACEYVMIDLKDKRPYEFRRIELTNFEGKVVKTLILRLKEDNIVLDTRNLETGQYQVTLYENGKKHQTRKLLIIR